MMEDYEKLASEVRTKPFSVLFFKTFLKELLSLRSFVSMDDDLIVLLVLPPAAGVDPSDHPLAGEPNPGEDRK